MFFCLLTGDCLEFLLKLLRESSEIACVGSRSEGWQDSDDCFCLLQLLTTAEQAYSRDGVEAKSGTKQWNYCFGFRLHQLFAFDGA
eukprot:scaffold90494_cov38-Cyclotella_meneghiniana.AAC.2